MLPTAELAALIASLSRFEHPLLRAGWASKFVRHGADGIELVLPFVSASLVKAITEFVAAQPALPNIRITQQVAAMQVREKTPLAGVKNLLVVSSAKGGVGKSTTAANLALALKQQGATVGLLDADIYGPSLPILFGTQGMRPTTVDNKMMQPVLAHGIATQSIGYLIAQTDAMVWRGPMAAKAFSQLVNETHWQALDYLVVDMPPGTGDIALNLAQQFPVTAAIVITTPQDLARVDAVKGISMFEKVSVPVLGVVENMSYHRCTNCGHQEAIFGSGAADSIAKAQHISLLAKLPLAMAIRADSDAGTPTVAAAPESEYAQLYLHLAEKVASELYWQGSALPERIAIMLQP